MSELSLVEHVKIVAESMRGHAKHADGPDEREEYLRMAGVCERAAEGLQLTSADYDAARESHLKHVRDLDVAMVGEGAAKRPLLIDIKAELLKRIEFYKLYEAYTANQDFAALLKKWRIKA